jgi:hypothetical protein
VQKRAPERAAECDGEPSRARNRIAAPRAHRRIDRYAANLIWKPVENLQTGGELGWVDFALRTNGAAGFGSALVSYLFATWTF